MHILLGRFDTLTLYPNLHQIYVTSKGSMNQVADVLSQAQEVSQVSTPAIDFEQLVIAQRDHAELSELQSAPNSLELKGN